MSNEPNPRHARHRAPANAEYAGQRGAAGAAGARGSEGAAASGAGASTAAAAEQNGGVPLRGLAMILLAVGAGLALWGVFLLTGSGDEATTANSETAQTTGQEAANGQNNPGQSGQPGDNQDQPQSGQPGQDDPAKKSADRTSTASSTSKQPAPATTDVKQVPITVLNNSLVPKLADTVSTKLAEEGWNTGKTGNWSEAPDGSGNIAETTVFYTKDNPEEKAAAEALAQELGVQAKPRFPELDQASQGVTLILTAALR